MSTINDIPRRSGDQRFWWRRQ